MNEMVKNELSLGGKVGLKEAISHLENTLAALKKGTLVLEKDEQNIVLIPEKDVWFEIEATQKESKEKFSFKMGWQKSVPEPEEVPMEFKISSKVPKKKEEPEEKKEEE
jgi:amphi-Trp domain-containing protein